jgi:Arc/MetJ-type ribon-helix-helix transcriptional regulator
MAKLELIEPRRKESDSEKITINLGYVDLGQIDLLVQEGFYSDRTDFIRTAIRGQLGTHSDVVKQTVARRSLVLGLQRYTRHEHLVPRTVCGRRRPFRSRLRKRARSSIRVRSYARRAGVNGWMQHRFKASSSGHTDYRIPR